MMNEWEWKRIPCEVAGDETNGFYLKVPEKQYWQLQNSIKVMREALEHYVNKYKKGRRIQTFNSNVSQKAREALDVCSKGEFKNGNA